MHTQRRYATCPQGILKKEKKMHTQRSYATCLQGMSKEKEKKKGSPYPRKIKEREKSCKGVPPLSTKKIHTLAHHDQDL